MRSDPDPGLHASGAPWLGSVYGLVAACDVPLTDLAPADIDAQPDFEIGTAPLDWDAQGNPPLIERHYRGRPGELWIDLPGKLMLRISGGRSITYLPDPATTMAEVQVHLLGSGLGALMMQRGQLVLHANAIAMPDGTAIMCMGPSGVGKSTAAAAMMQRGYRVLADDVCPIGSDGKIYPGLARMKLWDDSANRVGIATQGLEYVPGTRAKRNVPLPHQQPRDPATPGLLVLLEAAPVGTITATNLSGAAKFSALRSNVYRSFFNRGLGLGEEWLAAIARLGATTDMVQITRPERGFEIDALVDTILECHASRSLRDTSGQGIGALNKGDSQT